MEEITTCASILLYYVKKAGNKALVNYGTENKLDKQIEVEAISEEELANHRIN
jgi:hypothetical protein